jgi:hypothetical protein
VGWRWREVFLLLFLLLAVLGILAFCLFLLVRFRFGLSL